MQILSYVLFPFICCLSLIRCFLGKEERSDRPERFGYPSCPRPEGDLVWFHGASVGEIVSLSKVIERYLELFPHNILVTTTTRTGQETARRLFPGCIIQYIPYDLWFSMERFLNHWNPLWCCLIDSEIWPCLVSLLRKKNTYLYVINAKLSDKSYARWKKFPKIAKAFFSKIRCIWTPSQEMAEKFLSLNVPHAIISSNLKFFASKLPVCEAPNITRWLDHRPVWIAASTHEGEEEMMIRVHKKLKKVIPDVVTIIIPRHPHRASHIQDQDATLSSQCRTGTSILIHDQLGNLGMFYALESIVCMGKTFCKNGGGHNPIEPLLFKNLVLFGPDMSNFTDILTLWGTDALVCQDEEHLLETLQTYLQNPTLKEVKIAPVFNRLLDIRQKGVDALVEELGR